MLNKIARTSRYRSWHDQMVAHGVVDRPAVLAFRARNRAVFLPSHGEVHQDHVLAQAQVNGRRLNVADLPGLLVHMQIVSLCGTTFAILRPLRRRQVNPLSELRWQQVRYRVPVELGDQH